MKSEQTNRKSDAFTLIEVLCVVAIIAILAALLLPTLNQGQAKARRIQCVDNLKQVGVGFHAFMHDHQGRFPMQVSMSEGGSMEFAQNGYRVAGAFYFSYRHFAALSNELETPKLLACPADSRWPAKNFAAFNNDSLSYFVGVQADFMTPYSILAGDRNVTNDRAASPTLIRSTATQPFRWTEELHRFRGNLLFADGHVQEFNEAGLSKVGSPSLAADLVLPSPNPGVASSGNTVPSSKPAPTIRAETSAKASRPAAPEKSHPPGAILVVSAKGTEPVVASPGVTVSIETNPPPVVPPVVTASNPPPATNQVVPASGGAGGSGFTVWMDEVAVRLHLPVWLLYLLLLLLLAGVGTMLLRLRSR